jgi:hypothetical protein
MSDSSSWEAFEPQLYTIPKVVGEDQINRVIENMKRSGVEDT